MCDTGVRCEACRKGTLAPGHACDDGLAAGQRKAAASCPGAHRRRLYDVKKRVGCKNRSLDGTAGRNTARVALQRSEPESPRAAIDGLVIAIFTFMYHAQTMLVVTVVLLRRLNLKLESFVSKRHRNGQAICPCDHYEV